MSTELPQWIGFVDHSFSHNTCKSDSSVDIDVTSIFCRKGTHFSREAPVFQCSYKFAFGPL
jgi:hypothetical protein